jgi:hypothetical protein
MDRKKSEKKNYQVDWTHPDSVRSVPGSIHGSCIMQKRYERTIKAAVFIREKKTSFANRR